MTKIHNVELTISNETGETLQFSNDWFQTGRLADGESWPATIAPKASATIRCYEKDWSPLGCSGWVSYTFRGAPMYLCFSNPTVGDNGIDFGGTTDIWQDMGGQYFPVQRPIQLGSAWAAADMVGTGGDVNQASWTISAPDVTTVVPANLELNAVERAYAQFPTTGSRRYYRCNDDPTGATGLIKSHFKGISAIARKLIFTHTNLLGLDQTNGRYLIADRITTGSQGQVGATRDTLHPGWLHPCSSQACGSFMAMGIQADESGPGSKVSEIQILDVRMCQVNQPAILLGAIARPDDGVNGVAMTRESGDNGRYVVAGVNGNNLTVYRSKTGSLTNAEGLVDFDQVLLTNSFQDSGAGLALVTQKGDGTLYLFALNADDSGANNQLNLYRLDLGATPSCTQVATKDMDIPGMSESVSLLQEYAVLLGPLFVVLAAFGASILNSSFRWGKGLTVTSEGSFEVYASDRNALPLSHIPAIGSDKDFSLAVWTSDTTSTSFS